MIGDNVLNGVMRVCCDLRNVSHVGFYRACSPNVNPLNGRNVRNTSDVHGDSCRTLKAGRNMQVTVDCLIHLSLWKPSQSSPNRLGRR